jgi:uncharacterized protein
MQKVKLPVEVEPFRAAKRRLDYQGIVPAGQMPRLAQATLAVSKDAEASIHFEIDPQGLTVMTGEATTEVVLECQRCGEPFNLALHVEFQYAPVNDHQLMDELPQAYEPLELNENGEFYLRQVLEDEFLLALPLIAMHSLADCKVQEQVRTFGEIPTQEGNMQPNPFAILQSLKKEN